MPTNNFKLFDENKANIMTDAEYATNQQRLNGVQSGVASSQLQNKTLYQTSLMCYALAQLMAANGYDANDANAVSTFVNNLSSSVVQKIADKASISDVDAGTSDTKYITPLKLKNAITKAKPISDVSNPTNGTVGFLGQIYVNTTAHRAFICTNTTGGYTWEKIPIYKTVKKVELITTSQKWIVPSGVSSIMVRLFGAGGSGSYCGGGGGHMAVNTFSVNEGDSYNITIGEGKAASNGGASSFGSLLTANGGSSGGSGGSGGGGIQLGTSISINGGNGSYGGGGGGGKSVVSDYEYTVQGGNGGQYGGGGGGGGNGGQYGGNGGSSSSGNATAGTNTVGMGLDFEGQGLAGATGGRYADGYGGGGGYGGNGGNGGTPYSSGYGCGYGGGGGYGGNGGNGATGSVTEAGGGGGGGYGGNGGNGYASRGGGGGGYGLNGNGAGSGNSVAGIAAGGANSSKGGNGICIITYEALEVV